MYDEPRGSFRSWLIQQCERQDSVGDLARDVRVDSCLGQKRTPNTILMDLQSHGPLSAPRFAHLRKRYRSGDDRNPSSVLPDTRDWLCGVPRGSIFSSSRAAPHVSQVTGPPVGGGIFAAGLFGLAVFQP
jgi:hypothetical protein